MLARSLLALALLLLPLPAVPAKRQPRSPKELTSLELPPNCEDLLVERLHREGVFADLASRYLQHSKYSFEPHLVRSRGRLTTARALQKITSLISRAGTRYAMLGPRPETNLTNLALPAFDPAAPRTSLRLQLQTLRDRRSGPYTLVLDLTGEEQSLVETTSANRQFWTRLHRMVNRDSRVVPALTIVGVTERQVPMNFRVRHALNPWRYLRLPPLILTQLD